MARRRIPASAKGATEPLKITEDERRGLLDCAWRRQKVENEAQIALATIQADERAIFEALATRIGIEPAEIGTRYAINSQSWILEAR